MSQGMARRRPPVVWGRLKAVACLLWPVWLVSQGHMAWAQVAPSVDDYLPEVRVQARGLAVQTQEAAHHVTVITAQDIARSSATSVTDLLSAQGNLSLQSYFGHDKDAGIDMRGMGVTAGSNVLIVVDGVRLNANDMSGSDLSALTLSQIERVEIIRGGGSVREGNGAVGGVIRITTRRSVPQDTSVTDLQARVGAYRSTNLDLNSATHVGPVTALVHLDRHESQGYRDNGGFNGSNASLSLRWSPMLGSVNSDFYVKGTQGRDSYGLPGPVSLADFQGDARARRSTQHPLDGGTTETQRYDLGAALDWGQPGRLEWRSSHRDRHNPYLLGVDSARPLQDQQSQIISGQWDHHVSYTLDGTLLGLAHSSSVGWDSMNGQYQRWEGGLSVAGGTRLLGEASSRGMYAESTLKPSQDVAIHAGVRWNHFSTRQRSESYEQECVYDNSQFPPILLGCPPFAYLPSGAAQSHAWFNRSAELGLNWQFVPTFSGFVSASRTFRAPNIDELLLAASTLRPQQGLTREVGIRHQASASVAWSATLFDIENEAEIYYGMDPSGSQVNRNRDGLTRRRGLELDAHWQPVQSVRLHGQLSHLSPRVEGVSGDIPLVARTTASAQLEWQAATAWRWTLAGRYVGGRLDGDAMDSDRTAFAKLHAYSVWDAAVRYGHGAAQLTLGVNNLFNEIYSTQAFAQTYYPMPERHVYVTLGWRL